MPAAQRDPGADKFSRYRQSKQSSGLKLLRVWTPDPTAPGFAAEAARQATLLRGMSEEQEALSFIDAAMDPDTAA